MNRTDTLLRLHGYAVDTQQGRIACRAGVTPRHFDPNSWRPIDQINAERLAQTWLVGIVVAVAHGDGREIVDALITAADSPRALVGRTKAGSAVLLFKCPPGMSGANTREEYGSRDGSLRFSLATVSEGASVDVSAYSWDKARSPVEFERDRLPTFTLDAAALVTEAAKARCVPWSIVEMAKADEASASRYATMRIPTAQEEAEAEEERLVADNEGRHISMWDGPLADAILRARKVVAVRRAARGEAVSP